MNPDNTTTSRAKTWVQQTFTPEYFKRVAFALTLCLVIYMAYLFTKNATVDFGALGIFVVVSFLTQLFFSQPQKNKIF